MGQKKIKKGNKDGRVKERKSKGGKKKRKRKGKKKTLEPCVDDIKTTAELTRTQLMTYMLGLKEEIQKERELKFKFQTERDKISIFWEIARTKISVYEGRARCAERHIEEAAETSEKTLEVNRQKQKYLQNELTNELGDVEIDCHAILHALIFKNAAQQAQLHQDNVDLSTQLSEMKLAIQEDMRLTKKLHSEELDKCAVDFEQNKREILEAEEFLLQKKKKLEHERYSAVKEIKRYKNEKIAEIINEQNREMQEVRVYYNTISMKNLALVEKLRKELDKYKRDKDVAENNEKLYLLSAAERLSILQSTRQDISALRTANTAARLEKYKENTIVKQKRGIALGNEHKEVKLHFEMLKQKHEWELAQRDDIETRLTKASLELQQRAVLRGTLAKKCATAALASAVSGRNNDFNTN